MKATGTTSPATTVARATVVAIPPAAAEHRGEAPGRARLTGRRIAVIGAGQAAYPIDGPAPIGNGRAISVLCAREGADVALFDIDPAAVARTAEMAVAEGVRASTGVGDATDQNDVSEFLTSAARELGGLDGLVLVVGGGSSGDLESTSVAEWDRTFALNVRSQFIALQLALPLLADGSSIVMISSIAAYAPVHEMVAYHAAKASLEGLKNVVARLAAARGIRVNIVAPGSIDTAAGRYGSTVSPEYKAAADAGHPQIPLRRLGTG